MADFPINCYTCHELLGHLAILFKEETKKITNNLNLTGEEQAELKAKFLEKHNVKKMCCRKIFIAYRDPNEILMTKNE